MVSTALPSQRVRYTAPALEKGLDIIEVLASEGQGMTLKALADRLKRSSSEIYRMLVILERRGYLRREVPAETYHLTNHLFELSHRHPPTGRLIDAAMPIMRQLAKVTRQSCHLAVTHADRMLVIANVDSPEPRGFVVRLGANFPILETASGRVLLAFADAATRDDLLRTLTPLSRKKWHAKLQQVRTRGGIRVRSAMVAGIIDLSCPVLDYTGHAAAALTIPYLVERGLRREAADAVHQLADAARRISAVIGGGATNEDCAGSR